MRIERKSLSSESRPKRSLGCVGILRCWFLRAADLALSENAETLSLEHLKQLEPSNAEWCSIATALLEDEEAFRVSDLEIELLRSPFSQKNFGLIPVTTV
jgi:hypothetical protein